LLIERLSKKKIIWNISKKEKEQERKKRRKNVGEKVLRGEKNRKRPNKKEEMPKRRIRRRERVNKEKSKEKKEIGGGLESRSKLIKEEQDVETETGPSLPLFLPFFPPPLCLCSSVTPLPSRVPFTRLDKAIVAQNVHTCVASIMWRQKRSYFYFFYYFFLHGLFCLCRY
jgi:hypothetical protein